MTPSIPGAQPPRTTLPLASENEDFFKTLEQSLHNKREAIHELFRLLCRNDIPSLEKIYEYIFILFPDFNADDFKTFREYLPFLLKGGSKSQQDRLMLELRFWELHFWDPHDSKPAHIWDQDSNPIHVVDQLLTWLKQIKRLPSYPKMYIYLCQWLTYFKGHHYGSLIGSLQSLLNHSRECSQEQIQLALKLANWNLETAAKESMAQRPRLHLEAAHYLAKAVQIADKKKLNSKEAHKTASKLIGECYLETGPFKDFQINLERAKGNTQEFKELLSRLDQLEKFCCGKKFYLYAQSLISSTQQSSFTCWYDDEILDKVNLGVARIDPRQIATQCYLQKLQELKKAYQDFHQRYQNVPKSEEVRHFQASITQKYADLIQCFLEDIFIVLGKPSCSCNVRAMGSLGREEPCVFSDFEVMIFYEKKECQSYFENLVELLKLQICSLGETDRDDLVKRLVFTCAHEKNPQGFMIEGNSSDFLRTPIEMADLQKTSSEDTSTLAHMSLKSTTLFFFDPASKASNSLFVEYQKSVEANPKELRDLQALGYLKTRLADFRKVWRRPCVPAALDLKKQYIALLHYLLADLSLFWGIETANTLDLVKDLIDKDVFTQKSGELLKEAVSTIYFIRSRLHLSYQEPKDVGLTNHQGIPLNEEQKFFTTEEASKLEKYFWLILIPIYSRLSCIIDKQEPWKPVFKSFNLDLVENGLSGPLFKEPPASLVPMIFHLVSYLIETKASSEVHRENFKKLSEQLETEPLRKAYLEALEKYQAQEVIDKLIDIHNIAGFRYSFLRSSQKLQTSLLSMLSSRPHTEKDLPQVQVISPTLGGYLKPEAVRKILDKNGDIHNCYGSAHPVCPFKGLHFKQKPYQSLMEYAVHNLIYRIAGCLTPATQLVRFEVQIPGKKPYPVIISETISPVQNLEDVQKLPKLEPAQWARWTWMLLCTVLTRPGDGLLPNYVLDRFGNIFCVDNDISFVEPVVEKGGSKIINFCSALFCLFTHTPLDKEAIQQFCTLDVDSILTAWIDDVIEKEKEYLGLFSEEERKQLYSEDPDRCFKATISFREGTLTTLNVQFYRLQNFLLTSRGVTAHDLLKQMISIRDKRGTENDAGFHLFGAYSKASGATVKEKLGHIIRHRGASLRSPQAHEASLGKPLPSFEEVEKLKIWTPTEAKSELFVTLLKRCSRYISARVVGNKKIIGADFGNLKSDPVRQSLILKGLAYLAHLEDLPTSITLQRCAVLDSKTLESFLHSNLECLDLSFCPLIEDKDVINIQQKCPALRELYLTGCTKLKYLPLGLKKLEHLQIEQCDNLVSMHLKAPALKTLMASKNPQLSVVEIQELEIFPWMEFNQCPKLDSKAIFKRTLDQLLVLVIKTRQNVFSSPLSIALCHRLAEVIVHEIATKGFENASKYIESLFHFIEMGLPQLAPTTTTIATFLNFAHVSFSGRKFRHTHIPGADLRRALLMGTDLQGADLTGVNLSEAILSHAQLDHALMDKVLLEPHIIRCDSEVNTLISDFTERQLIGGCRDGSIHIWDIKTGQELKKLKGHVQGVTSLLEIEKGKSLASGSHDGMICLWNLETGEVKKLKGHTGSITKLILLGGKKLASVSSDRTIRQWNLETGQEIKKLQRRIGYISALTEIEGVEQLAIGDNFGTICLWDIKTEKALLTLNGHTQEVTALVMKKGKKLISGSHDKTICLWDIVTGKVLKKFEHKYPILALSLLEGEKKLVFSSSDRSIHLLDTETWQELKKFENHADFVMTLTTIEGGKRIASGNGGKTIRLWSTGTEQESKKGHTERVTNLTLLEGGKSLASGSRDGTIRLWNVQTGRELKKLERPTGAVRALTLINKQMVSAGDDGTIDLWDMETGEIKKLKGHTAGVTTLAEMDKGKKLVSGSDDRTIRLWDVKTGLVIKKFEGHTQIVTALIILDGEKKLASASYDQTICLWNVETGLVIKKFEGHTDFVKTLTVMEGGKKLASGSSDNTIRLWDTDTGQQIKKLEGHTAGVTTLLVMEEGRKLISGSYDRTIRLWDVVTEKELFKVVLNYDISSLVLKEPGLLFAGDAAGGIWCWRLNLQDPRTPFLLQWATHPTLMCHDVKMGNVLNLSETNKNIMLQYGAQL